MWIILVTYIISIPIVYKIAYYFCDDDPMMWFDGENISRKTDACLITTAYNLLIAVLAQIIVILFRHQT